MVISRGNPRKTWMGVALAHLCELAILIKGPGGQEMRDSSGVRGKWGNEELIDLFYRK